MINSMKIAVSLKLMSEIITILMLDCSYYSNQWKSDRTPINIIEILLLLMDLNGSRTSKRYIDASFNPIKELERFELTSYVAGPSVR